MTHKALGKSHREGISLIELGDMFPDEESAHKWFEAQIWPKGRHCQRCGSTRTHEASHAKMPYRCSDCRSYFSAKTGTALEGSRIPLRKWVFAVYLEVTSLKGVSSMKLHRDLKVTQKTAWFMLHRLREVWAHEKGGPFSGPSEVDETYMGGSRKNMPASKRKTLKGRDTAGKSIVVGAKDRATNKVSAKVIEEADAKTLQTFVARRTEEKSTVYTDDASAYKGMKDRQHESVRHSAGEYVRDMAHTNGIESFWSMLKRAHKGTFHKISRKHLQRYVDQFVGKHNFHDIDTIEQMQSVIAGIIGKRLMYKELISENGLSSGARGDG